MIWSLIAAACSGGSNAALLAAINAVVKRNGSASVLLVWSFVGLCLLLPISRFVSEFLLNRLGQEALYALRIDLCRQILAAPLRHLETIGTASLLVTLTEDVPNITGTILIVPLLCVNAAVVIGCIVYMGYLSGVLMAVVLGFMVIGIISYQLPVLKAQSVFRLARQDSDALQKHLRALTEGTKELKMHAERRYEFVNNVFESTAASFRHNNIAGKKIYTAAESWGQTLVFVVVGLIILGLPKLRHVDGITLTGYAFALLYLVTPLQVIMNMFPMLGRANVALDKVRQLGFSLISDSKEDIAQVAVVRSWKKLELQSVTHTYSRERETNDFILGPIDLSFRSGELVFITGGNGTGKTTLAKLLTGLYTPETGEIYLDDLPISTIEARIQYRQYFSAIFSDFYLFEQLLGLKDCDLDKQAKRYLDQLKLSNKVQIHDRQISTIDLSQGQRKRLALLTAYLEDRPIYLFDEWAADQDPYFRNIFYVQLLPELKAKGKTIFVITHDDRYYHVADRVIRLDEGRVVSDSENCDTRDVLQVTSR